jgi:hypothetical protein
MSPYFLNYYITGVGRSDEGLDLQAGGQSTLEENLVTGTGHRTRRGSAGVAARKRSIRDAQLPT